MNYQFCTLFDKNYLYNGLALHASLLRHCSNFTLWILCLDETAYRILSKLDLKKAKLVSLAEFENEDLLRVKQNRTAGEYAWTCAANFCKYVLEKYQPDSITYLDSDVYFFSGPDEIFKEIGSADIAIIEHRYSKEYSHLEKQSGTFCVEWVTFKNSEEGAKAVNWWSKKVLEWCYARYEDGKFGDQLYLNDWPRRFQGVHIIEHKGAGLAPWNLRNYALQIQGSQILTGGQNLIFYHFHTFHPISYNLYVRAIGYGLPRQAARLIYRPYIIAIKQSIDAVKNTDRNFNFGFRKFNIKEFFGEKIKTFLNH
ncbi:MAG: glycosyl transferase [Patescibacteria group bacterium]|nr:glycosyl transferase [Patescibacteria group bacterium]